MNTDPLFQTPICRRLGIQCPIFQAGMGYVAHAELAAAVSNAGGLGCIGSGSMGSRELREQIRRCRDVIGAGVLDLSLQDPGTGDSGAMMGALELFGRKVLPRIREI